MICFMYPGQPLALAATLPDDADFAAIAALTQQCTGYNLTTNQWQGIAETDQVALQIYGCAMSLYRTRQIRATGLVPQIIAEHSMGIYPALAASGALSEGDALELTCRIGGCLAQLANSATYALGCIIGLAATPVLALAENNGVYLANHNTSRHFLLAGEHHGVEAALAEALAAGAFSVSLFPCDAPLHTPLVEAIVPDLRQIVRDYSFVEPKVPLMEHIEQDCLTAVEIPEFLVTELSRPVHWEATYQALRRVGVTVWHEAGSGEALKKYNRWIASESL